MAFGRHPGIVAYWEKAWPGRHGPLKLKANNVRFFEGSGGGVIQAVIRGDVHVANSPTFR